MHRASADVTSANPLLRCRISDALSLETSAYSIALRYERGDDVERRVQNEVNAPFDVLREPLIRLTLYAVSPTEHLLSVVAHHCIFDGSSRKHLLQQLARAYRGDPIDAATTAPRDAAELETAAGRACRVAWPLCGDRTDDTAGTVTTTLDPDICRQASSRMRLTRFQVVVVAWAWTLCHYVGTRDLVLGVPINRRRDASIGCDVHLGHLRVVCDADTSLAAFASDVCAQMGGSMRHTLAVADDIDALVTAMDDIEDANMFGADLRVSRLPRPRPRHVKCDLTLFVDAFADFHVDYRRALLDVGYADGIAAALGATLHAMRVGADPPPWRVPPLRIGDCRVCECADRFGVYCTGEEAARSAYDHAFVHEKYLQHGIRIDGHAVVMDVGAGIGMFGIFAHRSAASVHVFAFEPSPRLYGCLARNMLLHGVASTVDRRRLSDRAGEGQLTYSAILDEHAVTRVDLLRIAAGGPQLLRILDGVRPDHWERIAQIVIETEDAPAARRAVAVLQERGYAVAQQDAGTVYARRPQQLSRDEDELVRCTFNGVRDTVPDVCMHEHLTAAACAYAGAHAVEHGATYVEYGALLDRSRGTAAVLASRGVQAREVVGIMAPRSVAYIACIVGTLIAGAAFLPVDATYPAARIEGMMEDACPRVVIASSAARNLGTRRSSTWTSRTRTPTRAARRTRASRLRH